MKVDHHKGHWFWGSTKEFASSTLGFVQMCMKEYTEICYAKIGFKNFYLPLNADLADYVLRVNNKNYKKSFAYSGLKVFLGNGLLTNEGAKWLAQRRLIQPAFYKDSINDLRQIMMETTLEEIKSWEGEVNLTERINHITRTIITKAIFGNNLDENPDLEQLPEILNTFRTYGNDKMKNPLKLPLWVPSSSNKTFKSHFATFKKIIDQGIAKRRAKPDGYSDILALFIHLSDEDGEKMNDQQVFDEIATLFIAGQETTTNALLFALYELDKNPNVKKTLQEKIKTKTEDASTFLKNCCLETLRLRPPAWAISREAINDDQVGNAEVKSGDTVFVPIYAYHRNPVIWEKADEFYPDRFNLEYPKKWYMPFGTGPRFCIGNHFAELEMNLVLKEIFSSLDYSIKSPEEMSFTTLMTLAPKEIITAEFKKNN